MAKGILEHVYEILKQAGGPVDIQQLTTQLFEKGLLPDDGKKERHHLYTRLFMDISNKGEESRFRKVGRGVFCLVGSEEPAVESVEGRSCGNCQYISYSGIQELTMITGYCENHETSSRHYVQRGDEPCSAWRRRAPDKVIQDVLKRQKLRQKVELFNLKHRGRRRLL